MLQVFLLSTRAGGAGLNLIGANHLVRCSDTCYTRAVTLQEAGDCPKHMLLFVAFNADITDSKE